MLTISLTFLLHLSAFPLATAYPALVDTLNCRTSPSTGAAIQRTYTEKQEVTMSCQISGENVDGNPVWDRTSDGCYVADRWIRTGVDGFLSTVSRCSAVITSRTSSNSYPVTADTLNCRSAPNTDAAVQRTYKNGQKVAITCQVNGESVDGYTIWDKTSDGCYVSDKYVHTGKDGFITDVRCNGVEHSPSKIPGLMKDDYPYKGHCHDETWDKWMYYRCQCTSFVAWRINDRLGVSFSNKYKGQPWGNAIEWKGAARNSGVTVNSNPVPGSIAWKGAYEWSEYGHVAWVSKVNGDKVTIEEYNAATPEGYGTRVVSKGYFEYIHVKV